MNITTTTAHGKEYKVCNGTHYHIETPDKVIRVFEECRANHTRIVLDYGDTTTGKSWGERYDITGYIGRTTGLHCPILLFNRRSMGGGIPLTHCILSIRETAGKHLLYNLQTGEK